MEGTVTSLRDPGSWGDGAFRADRFLRGLWVRGLFAGHRTSDGLRVFMARCPHHISILGRLDYEVPGIAPQLGVHGLDGLPAGGAPSVLVEVQPRGSFLQAFRGQGTSEDCVRIGCALARAVVSACERSILIEGLRPETVFLEGTPGALDLTGVTPRSAAVIGQGPLYAEVPAFGWDQFDPEQFAGEQPERAAYSVALVLWVLHQPDHPYGNYYGESAHRAREGMRDPWTGPPELGRILEPMLAYRLADRPSPQWMLAELEELARQWGIELPPFPPAWPAPPTETGPYR